MIKKNEIIIHASCDYGALYKRKRKLINVLLKIKYVILYYE